MFDGEIPQKTRTWTPERNAAIGKAGRLRIKNGHPPWRPKVGVVNPGPRKERRARPPQGRRVMRFAQDAINARLRIAPSPIPPQPPPEGSRTLMEVGGGDCRHPYGDRAPYSFCGLPIAFDGSSYCLAHRAINYIRLTPSTKRLIWRGR